MANDLVLLTGATGMIGFRTLVKLVEGGYRVRTAVRNVAGFERIKALKSVAPYASKIESIIVPDITVPGAYDEAVKGVKYIVHVASPLAGPKLANANLEVELIQPAVKGTVGMLESANKESSVKRIVITASIASILNFDNMGSEDVVVNETLRAPSAEGPFSSLMSAYAASKARAYNATEQWMSEKKPSFDLINILPVFVTGRDETVLDAQEITKGTNGLIMGLLLGYPRDSPTPGTVVHVDDVASMHVLSLNPEIAGNQDFLATAHSLKGINWNETFDIVKKHYPKECEDGIFKVDPAEKPQTIKALVDGTKAEKTFGIQFKSFEEQVISVVEHFLELIGRK